MLAAYFRSESASRSIPYEHQNITSRPGSLTNEQALSLINRSLALDEKIAQLRTRYVAIVNTVLPGTKTATFFQIVRRITALLDLQLASEIPLVQEQK